MRSHFDKSVIPLCPPWKGGLKLSLTLVPFDFAETLSELIDMKNIRCF